MKNILALIFVTITHITLAQATTNTGDFKKVKIFDNLRVKLIPSSENKIIISGNREDEVEILNKKGVLKLSMPYPILKSLSADDITINLFFKNIESIQAGQGSYVFSESVFKQTSIDLYAASGAQININVDVDKANVSSFTGGIIELSGKTTNQDINVSFGGDLKARELYTSQTKIIVSVGGKAEINSNLLVDADVKSGGSLFIYGKPKQLKKETILGGKIIEK